MKIQHLRLHCPTSQGPFLCIYSFWSNMVPRRVINLFTGEEHLFTIETMLSGRQSSLYNLDHLVRERNHRTFENVNFVWILVVWNYKESRHVRLTFFKEAHHFKLSFLLTRYLLNKWIFSAMSISLVHILACTFYL